MYICKTNNTENNLSHHEMFLKASDLFGVRVRCSVQINQIIHIHHIKGDLYDPQSESMIQRLSAHSSQHGGG